MHNVEDFYRELFKTLNKNNQDKSGDAKQFDELTNKIYDIYYSFIRVGFSETQAFELTKLITNKAIN